MNIKPNYHPSTHGQVQGAVSRIIPFSSVDGPGNRFALFLQGCNFDCCYCHNPETRPELSKLMAQKTNKYPANLGSLPNPESSVPNYYNPNVFKPQWFTTDQIMEQILLIKPFIRGITISGGECMLQPEFCLAVTKSALSLGLPTLLDSCGSVPFSQYMELMDSIEGIMLDLKAWDSKEHSRLTGKINQTVLDNLEWAADYTLLHEVRTVIVPSEFNVYETVIRTAELLAQKKVLCPYVLIPFRPHGVRKPWNSLEPPTAKLMEELRALAIKAGCKEVIIR
jgi:pyruvate formate lyase activating enzyme